MRSQYKAFKLDVKSVTESGQFEGYASTRAKDQGGDIVAEGAFKRTIDLNKGTFPILWFHDPTQPVGLGQVQEDGHGLFTTGRLNLDKQLGRDLHSDMKFGVVDRMSIGFVAVQSDWDEKQQARVITELKLLEYSLITKNFAMNEQALVTGVKHLHDPTVERFLNAYTLVSELSQGVKEGRVLSAKNRSHVQQAIEAMQQATASLSALLEAADPLPNTGKSHFGGDSASLEPREPSGNSEMLHLLRQHVASAKSVFEGVL